jgi:hypothetical protein
VTLLHDGAAAAIPEPLRCAVCNGTGTVVVLVAEKTWTCPEEYGDAPCYECLGSRVKSCTNCGDDADRIGKDGEPACSPGCSGGVFLDGDEPGEPDYDGGPDYAGMMASARALDRGGW